MTVNAVLPSAIYDDSGAVLTFIVPIPGGDCNLACPYCYIKQRGEDQVDTLLTPEEYRQFVDECTAQLPISALCIQGYEPLLDASIPYTNAILSIGQRHGIPTSLVSNGTHLEQHIGMLKELNVGRISISLDASTPGLHDRQRGKKGAFDATLRGLMGATQTLGRSSETELVVASVLLPKRRKQLHGIPSLLREIGIEEWVVTALQKVGSDSIGGPIASTGQILDDLRLLRNEAVSCGIKFVADDEFSRLVDIDDAFQREVPINRLQHPHGVYRLAPNGQCSKGTELLQSLVHQTPRWKSGAMNAGTFLRSL